MVGLAKENVKEVIKRKNELIFKMKNGSLEEQERFIKLFYNIDKLSDLEFVYNTDSKNLILFVTKDKRNEKKMEYSTEFLTQSEKEYIQECIISVM